MFLLYSMQHALSGSIGPFMVSVFRRLFEMTAYEAEDLYHFIRSFDLFFVFLLIVIDFSIILNFCLKWFSKYFVEVNASLDSLLQNNSEDVKLSRELEATENKINNIKRTLEKRRMEAQLSERRKNDLIIYLAHDLKTPLTSVIGYLTLLRDEKDISEEQREKYLSISLDKAQRLEELINEFFDITRFNLTDIELQCSNVNLTRLLEQSAYEFQPMLAEKNLTYSINAGENTMLYCDADKLQRVIDNLLRNAVFYSYENTEISINVEPTVEGISIIIANRGDTIPPEKLNRIFEQFFRLDSSRSTNTGGAGLGLAIAKKIAELHGGEIRAESADQIVRFIVTIPFNRVNIESKL